ncbi:MAG: cytochrome C oxidase subunit II [Geminicoccaceae bacterium]|jgi:cytochrome c oxidase subunit 2|nr:cytochrome C oxidase subunit II [Geminicoccaceae bacterium]MCB9966181.1 cytochrome C oxidase subunit II [Geminicoccaceae bacterium]HRY26127.1 cytochrome C oxidase subunit II [Geminicoccaceae bacterium]
MALLPPKNRLWWNEPLHRMEIVWITIAFLWGIAMFSTMIWWHIYGEQNLSNESYRILPEVYAERVEAMIEEYQVGEDEFGMPIVRPPVGADVYLQARLWDWSPILELVEGETYRLHISSLDWQHGFSLQPTNINLQVHPGYEMVVTLTPNESGEFGIVCNEFCGIGHHLMTGRINVLDREAAKAAGMQLAAGE